MASMAIFCFTRWSRGSMGLLSDGFAYLAFLEEGERVSPPRGGGPPFRRISTRQRKRWEGASLIHHPPLELKGGGGPLFFHSSGGRVRAFLSSAIRFSLDRGWEMGLPSPLVAFHSVAGEGPQWGRGISLYYSLPPSSSKAEVVLVFFLDGRGGLRG